MKSTAELSKRDRLKLKADCRVARRQINRMIKAMPPELTAREDGILNELMTSPGTASDKLRVVYTLFDEIGEHVSQFTPCQSGCGECCRMPVSLSTIEIDYIEKETGYRRVDEIIAREGTGGCPFLTEDTCAIYHARPFVCRRHAAYTRDNYWCHRDRCHTVEVGMVNFSGMEAAMAYLRSQTGSDTFIDIRDVFKAAR